MKISTVKCHPQAFHSPSWGFQ